MKEETATRVRRRRGHRAWRRAFPIAALALLTMAAPATAATGDGAEPFLTLENGGMVWHADASAGEPPPIVRVVRHAMREAGDRDVRESDAALRILSRHGLSRGWALLRLGERALAAGDSAKADSCWALASAARQAFQWPAARARHDLLLARRGPQAALGALIDPPCCGEAARTANLLRAMTWTAAGDSLDALVWLARRSIPVDSIERAVAWLERVHRQAGPEVRGAAVPPAARLWAQRAARIGMLDWLVEGLADVREPRARFDASIDAANGLRLVRQHTRARALLRALSSPAAAGDSAQRLLDLAHVHFTRARIERAADHFDDADAAYGEAIRMLEAPVARPAAPLAAARADLRAQAVRHRADLGLARGRYTHARRVLDASGVPGTGFDAAILSLMLGEPGEAERRFRALGDEGARYWEGLLLRRRGVARGDSLLRSVAASPWFDYYPARARAALDTLHAARIPGAGRPGPEGPAALRTAELLLQLGLRDAAVIPLELANEIQDGIDPAVPGEYIGSDGASWLRAARVAYQCGDIPLGIRLAHKARYRARKSSNVDPADAVAWLYPPAYDSLYAAHAQRHGLDPALLSALGWQESFFDASAVSRAGALGVMQFMPATARSVARAMGADPPSEADLLVAEHSIRLGGRYVADLLRRFGGKVPPALAAYNAGPGRADAWIRRANGDTDALFCEVIGFDETINYVKNILATWQAYRALQPSWSAGTTQP